MTTDKQREARTARSEAIIATGLPELPRSALVRRRGWFEDTRDGSYYRPEPDANPASAQGLSYFVDGGHAFLLRRVGSRDETAQARAESDARREAREAPVEALRAQIREAEIAATTAERERLAELRGTAT